MAYLVDILSVKKKNRCICLCSVDEVHQDTGRPLHASQLDSLVAMHVKYQFDPINGRQQGELDRVH